MTLSIDNWFGKFDKKKKKVYKYKYKKKRREKKKRMRIVVMKSLHSEKKTEI